MSRYVRAVCAATGGVMVIAGQSLGLFGGGSPTLMSPSSLPLILPAFLGVPAGLVAMLFGVVFLSWQTALLRGAAAVPRRTVILWAATTILSGAYFATSWRSGLLYEGLPYTRTSLVLNLFLLVVCTVLLWRARTVPSFGHALSAQTALFVWLATFAFPYLGEGP